MPERTHVEPEPTLAQRLLARAVLDRVTGCWIWSGQSQQPGFSALGESTAYRVAYVLWIGPLEPTDWVVRTCSNRRCINPYHLAALRPKRDRGAWPRRRTRKPRAAATHCRRGHPFTEENTVPNPGYVVVDGVRKKVMYRACRTCIELRSADYTPPKRPSPPSLRAIEDDNERFLEQIIRRVLRAPVAKRLYEIRLAVQEEFEWPGPGSIRYRALAFGEDYWEYRDRTERKGSFEQWLLSRIFSDPRIKKELLRPDVLVHDPLLREEMARARRHADDGQRKVREVATAVSPFPGSATTT